MGLKLITYLLDRGDTRGQDYSAIKNAVESEAQTADIFASMTSLYVFGCYKSL